MFAKIKLFLLSNQSINQTLAKNTFWLGFGEITSRLLKTIIIFYAIRILGASGWGTFSYAISLCGLFMIFSDFGISSILTRELAKPETNKEEYISTSFLIKILLNILIFIIIIFTAPVFSKDIIATHIIPIVALIMIFDGMREFIFAINRSLEKMEAEAVLKIVTNVLLIIITYIFLIQSATVTSLALGYMAGSLAGLIVTLFIFRKHLKNIFQGFSTDLIKPLITTAWPFAFFAILGSIMANTDTVMLGLMKDTTEVGFYATSQRIIAFLFILPGLIASSLLPTLTKQIHDKEKIKNVVNSSIKIIYMIAIPLTLGGLIISDSLIIKLFGAEYAPATVMFRISLISILVVFPALIFNNIIFIFNKHKLVVKISLIGALLNVLINIFLIPIYGGIGASIATLISQVVIIILIKKQLNEIIEIEMFTKLHKIIIASLVMSVILVLLKLGKMNFYATILISMAVYFTMLFVMKEETLKKFKTLSNAILQ